MKRYKILLLVFLGVISLLFGVWVWSVGFNTGKYTAQETPFNVPGRIVSSMAEESAIEKHKEELVSNEAVWTVGKKLPSFTLPTQENNETISLDEFNGKVLLVEFWASWCGPCRKKNGHLWDLYTEYNSQNFEILGVSMDRNLNKWRNAIAKDNMIWPQVCDGLGSDSPVMIKFGVYSLPKNFLLDKNGMIVAKNLKPAEIQNWLVENR